MPIFDFECPNGHRFESIRKITECSQVTIQCPTCQEQAARDVIPKVTHSSRNPNVAGSSLGIKFNWRPYN